MIDISQIEFDATIRSLHHVVIKSFLVGQARLTGYYQNQKVVGLIREYKGVRTYYKNEQASCE